MPHGHWVRASRHAILGLALALFAAGAPAIARAQAERADKTGVVAQESGPAAIARALDKITARITELRLPIDQEVRFGSLAIRARQCVARPPEETPESAAFLEIDEIGEEGRRRAFSGWMFASSPALNPLDHPVYDVWIIGCEAAADADAP
ncbi:MAG: hypothetical protein Kow00104_09630 [Rhodothalassiaceae bacterium]